MSGGSIRRSLLIFGRRFSQVGTCAVLLLCSTASIAAPITPGNLVVARATGGPNGDATSPLAGGGLAATIYLDEYTTSGVFVQSFKAPNVQNTAIGSQRGLTLSGAANTEGLLSLSGNGQYLVIGGYNQTANVAGTNGNASYNEASPATVVERVAGRMDLNGSWDTSTAFIDAMSAQSIRSAYSPDGTNFYVTGNGGNGITVAGSAKTTNGIHLGVLGVNTGGTTLSTQLNPAGLTTNNRQVLLYKGVVYVSNANTSGTQAPGRGVDKLAFDSVNNDNRLFSLPGFPTAAGPAPDDFWFFNDNTIYLADARTDGTNGGVQKWTFDGTNWSLQYTLGAGAGVLTTISGGNAGVHGLTGMIDGTGQAVLFGTTFDGTGANQTKFFTITDTGAASPVTYLGTSSTNSAFRGIEIIPNIPEPGSICLLVIGMLAGTAVRQRR